MATTHKWMQRVEIEGIDRPPQWSTCLILLFETSLELTLPKQSEEQETYEQKTNLILWINKLRSSMNSSTSSWRKRRWLTTMSFTPCSTGVRETMKVRILWLMGTSFTMSLMLNRFFQEERELSLQCFSMTQVTSLLRCFLDKRSEIKSRKLPSLLKMKSLKRLDQRVQKGSERVRRWSKSLKWLNLF